MAGAPLPNAECSRTTTFSGDVDFECNPLLDLGPQTDCVVEVTEDAGAATIDWTVAPVVVLSADEDTAPTFTWGTFLPDLRNQTGVLIIENTSGAGITITWPPEVIWPGGAAPAMPLGAGSTSQFVFQTLDDGTVVLGNVVGLEYS